MKLLKLWKRISLNLAGISLLSSLMIGSSNASFDEQLNTEYPVTENLEVPIVEVIEELIEDQNAPQFTVLNFHHFGEVEAYPTIGNITTSPKRFRELLEALKKEGYTTITQEQVQNYLESDEIIPEKSVLLTIDDGYESVYEHAYPVLKELGMTATLYPIIADIEFGQRLGVPMLKWEQLKEMAESDVMVIGNHTYDLHWRANNEIGSEALLWRFKANGIRMNGAEQKATFKSDFVKAEKVYKEKTGLDMAKTFSFPYGAYDKLTLVILKELVYKTAYTTEIGYNQLGDEANDLLQIKRIGIDNNVSSEQLIRLLMKNSMLATSPLEEVVAEIE